MKLDMNQVEIVLSVMVEDGNKAVLRQRKLCPTKVPLVPTSPSSLQSPSPSCPTIIIFLFDLTFSIYIDLIVVLLIIFCSFSKKIYIILS